MNSIFLFAATIVCVATFLTHFFVGGKFVAGPLLENTTLPRGSKWLNYYCWHVTSILLLLMVGAYLSAALTRQGVEMIVFLTIATACFSILSAAIAIKGRIKPWRFPSTSLFAALFVLGGLAVVS